MRTFICLLLLCFVLPPVKAQTETDSVKVTIDNLFKALRTSDSALLVQCFAPDAILQTIEKDQVNNTVVRTEPIAQFASIVKKIPSNTADERIVYDVIRIDVNLAVVWTPYQFYYSNKLVHCGVNSFQLVKLASGWKIQYIIDTRRKEGC
jgi:hypothetical protein